MGFSIWLLKFVTNIIVYFLVIRFLLQFNNAPVNNPFIQSIIKISNPIIKPFQRLIGSYRHINLGILLLILIINCLSITIHLLLTINAWPDVGGLLLWAIIKSAIQASQILLYATVVFALMSWFASLVQSPLGQCIIAIIYPIINLFRRFIPTIGMFDFSAMALVIALLIIRYVLSGLLFNAVALTLA